MDPAGNPVGAADLSLGEKGQREKKQRGPGGFIVGTICREQCTSYLS